MRPTRTLAAAISLLMLSGCHHQPAVPETPMPPNTILLSQMMRQLSAQPGAIEDVLHQLDPSLAPTGKRGPALLTPELLDKLRKQILGSDWQGLDRFPGWDMRKITASIDVLTHTVAKPTAPTPAASLLDLGPYSLNQSDTISLEQPSTLPPFTTEGIVAPLGHGITRGDGPNSLAPEHSESQRLAYILNRLAANQLDGVPHVNVLWNAERTPYLPEELIEDIIATGQTVTVTDTRYFANFAHFHFNGEDVMAPFWINTNLLIPNTNRPLLVPVAHAELEWHIRGPLLNADISYYFGIDGKAEWRTMDTLDQPWVLKRDAHTYTGDQAIEATRLAGLLTVAYQHLHIAHPELPFGGYFTLGVCQDGIAAIEKKLTGVTTLYPNTAREEFFSDTRDAEINTLIHSIPKDRENTVADPARVFGSLPIAPATTADRPSAFAVVAGASLPSDGPFDAVTIPGLASDLNLTYAAWRSGRLNKRHWLSSQTKITLLFGSIGLAAIWLALKTRHLFPQPSVQRKRR
ncbi:MAG: hypothetical protein V4555_07425 [Acidobacteriota bacterium]